ncbi:hypothetical protein V8C42DRAFT_254798 [Trichoderma barbatum]
MAVLFVCVFIPAGILMIWPWRGNIRAVWRKSHPCYYLTYPYYIYLTEMPLVRLLRSQKNIDSNDCYIILS